MPIFLTFIDNDENKGKSVGIYEDYRKPVQRIAAGYFQSKPDIEDATYPHLTQTQERSELNGVTKKIKKNNSRYRSTQQRILFHRHRGLNPRRNSSEQLANKGVY